MHKFTRNKLQVNLVKTGPVVSTEMTTGPYLLSGAKDNGQGRTPVSHGDKT